MKKTSNLRKAILGGFSGLALLAAGCGDMLMSSTGPKGPDIIYGPYVNLVNSMAKEDAEKSFGDKKAGDLKNAIDLYLSVGNLKGAEEYAPKLLRLDRALGLIALKQMQQCRDFYDNQNKEQPNLEEKPNIEERPKQLEENLEEKPKEAIYNR